MDFISLIFSLVCLGYVIKEIRSAKQNAANGMLGNQAQNVISVGVLFTFIGIAISLYNFDANTEKMIESLNAFIEGMKTAFYTSIIGMAAALVIKWIQAGVESKDDEDYRESLTDIKDIAKEVSANTKVTEVGLQSVKASIDTVNESHFDKQISAVASEVSANTRVLEAGLQSVKTSIDAGSNSRLGEQIAVVAAKMEGMVAAAKDSQSEMRQMAASMTAQANMLEQLGRTIGDSISAFGESQKKQTEALGFVIRESMNALGTKLEESSAEQIGILQSMNSSIASMRENEEKAAGAAMATLEETREYQRTSLANEAEQNRILTQNTQSIIGMGESFDTFVNNVKEVFGEAVIGALNRSMQNLNEQLEKQFGENFKELNDAVKALNVWQQEYKNIVDNSIKELNLIQETFKQFEDVVAKNVSEHIESLNTNLRTFTETSNTNVSVQKNLSEAVVSLNELVQAAKISIAETQKIFARFDEFTAEVIQNTNAGLTAHAEAVKQNVEILSETMKQNQLANNKALVEIAEKNAAALQDMSNEYVDSAKKVKDASLAVVMDTDHYVKQFGETSQAVIKEVADVLERFKADFKNNAADAVNNLENMFEVVAKNTDKQQDKAVKTLAAQLSKITMQMIENYNALMTRIADLDKLIARNGGR